MASNTTPEQKPSDAAAKEKASSVVSDDVEHNSILSLLVESNEAPSVVPNDISAIENDVAYFRIGNQYFSGPGDRPYVSICVLDPLITVERHREEYHIAARFNIETTILDYSTRQRDGHEIFFQDICLQYISSSAEEDLVMEPKSDASSAFTVTRASNTEISGNAGVSLSQAPSANISLGISRSREFTVQYTVNTWNVSAHRVAHSDPCPESDVPQYQWFWEATHRETESLTADLKHTVKRHVVVKRVVPVQDFPVEILERARGVLQAMAAEEEAKDPEKDNASRAESHAERKFWETILADWRKGSRRNDHYRTSLENLLHFRFCIQVRAKRRYGRLHRAFLLSGNRIKGKFLKPVYTKQFDIHRGFIRGPKSLPADFEPFFGSLSGENKRTVLKNMASIPLAETYDLQEILAEIKTRYNGKWDELQSRDWANLVRKETGIKEIEMQAEAEAEAEAEVEAEAEAEVEAEAEAEDEAEVEAFEH